jgi:hypothetical protein
MANNALIQGAATASKKFLDITDIVGQGLMSSDRAVQRPETVKKNDQYQNTVNEYMSKMKTGMDFSSFSPTETTAMRNFLVAERSRYAEAAKNLAKIEDSSSPEYMRHVDTMNDVNNSFMNLANQMNAYKENKLNYAQDQINGALSKGMDPNKNREAMIMYGFYDANNDKKSDAAYDSPFKILPGGNLGFDIDGNTVSFNDAPAPVYKNYKLANGILQKNEAIYKSGRVPSKIENDRYKLELEEALQDPNALRSIVYDFESELDMKDIGNIWDTNKDSEGAIDNIRNLVIGRLIGARDFVSKEGQKEKEAKANKKAIANSNTNADDIGVKKTEPIKQEDGTFVVGIINAKGKMIGTEIIQPESTTK